ncbi:TPA: translation initiation factor IF-6, partial [Candidatus Bathyarchaeota archaeon]|nr:translation initiation factor IF-6 [Candidatus Bathyarchaeota archaeon]
MSIIIEDVFGTPNIGVFCLSTEEKLFVPFGLPERKIERFEECLKVEACSTSVSGSKLIGVLTAANSKGIIVPRTIKENEVKALKALDLNIIMPKVKWTAFGNLILVNDFGAVVDPRLPKSLIKKLKDNFGVEVSLGEISGLPYVGSLAVATNRAVLVNPFIKEEEKKLLEDVLKVPAFPGAVNNGVSFPKSGLLANTKGAVVGSLTSGKELMAITRA